jgi:Superinfection immunity protein/Short C-terminal domain
MVYIAGGIVAFLLYFFPSIVGYKHRNADSICILNLFLGWTFIGWVVALIWAFSNDKKDKVEIDSKTSVPEHLKQLKELYDDGTLTKEEFENEKKRVLKG